MKTSDSLHRGDRVLYISGDHGVSDSNPLVGTNYECAGTVVDTGGHGMHVRVHWDNGLSNSYNLGDLKIAPKGYALMQDPNRAFLNKKIKGEI